MRLDERRTRELCRRLTNPTPSFTELRDRLCAAIVRAERIVDEYDGYPATASPSDAPGGGGESRTERAALMRLNRSAYREHVVQAVVALDRAIADLDTVDSQLTYAEKLVDPDQTQKVARCFCCARHGVDMTPDHRCDPGKNLGQVIDVCHACFQYVRRTGELPPRDVILRRQAS